MHVFLEVGLYLEKPLITRNEIIEFVKNNSQEYLLGGYRNGSSPLETNVSLSILIPNEVREEVIKKINKESYNQKTINDYKKILRDKYDLHREKEIFFAEISGTELLNEKLEDFMSSIGENEGFSLKITNENIISYNLNWDLTLLEPTFDNNYNHKKTEDLNELEQELLKKYEINTKNKYQKIFLSDDIKSGFVLEGNKVIEVFSDEVDRENELLVSIQKETPNTGKLYVDLNEIVENFTEENLEKQQVLIGRTLTKEEKIIMFGVFIDFNNLPVEEFVHYSSIKESKKIDNMINCVM